MSSREKDLTASLEWRYATKRFDSSRKLSAEQWAALEAALILTPSSYGLQPWRFIVVTEMSLREKLKAVTWNQTQVTECSHYVVLTAKETMDPERIEKLINAMVNERGLPQGSLKGYQDMMLGSIRGKSDFELGEWNARQVYIALGQLMAAAACLRVDACPLEGLDPLKYDEILGLKGTGYRTIVACALGFRSSEDRLATAKKIRFDRGEIIQTID